MNVTGGISLAIIVVVLAGTVALTGAASSDDGSEAFALSRAGDADDGRQIFARCRSCHNLESGTLTKTGPNLDDLFGRLAGSSISYNRYSRALTDSGIVWSEKSIDEWISDPRNFLPGNKMALAPIRNRQDRLDLIAYLRDVLEP